MAAIDGPARGSRYADQRHYVVSASLADCYRPQRGQLRAGSAYGRPRGSRDLLDLQVTMTELYLFNRDR
jgi:hypothetical protein